MLGIHWDNGQENRNYYFGFCAWGSPKMRGTSSGVPIIRTLAFVDLHWGPLTKRNYQGSSSARAWNSSSVNSTNIRPDVAERTVRRAIQLFRTDNVLLQRTIWDPRNQGFPFCPEFLATAPGTRLLIASCWHRHHQYTYNDSQIPTAQFRYDITGAKEMKIIFLGFLCSLNQA